MKADYNTDWKKEINATYSKEYVLDIKNDMKAIYSFLEAKSNLHSQLSTKEHESFHLSPTIKNIYLQSSYFR